MKTPKDLVNKIYINFMYKFINQNSETSYNQLQHAEI